MPSKLAKVKQKTIGVARLGALGWFALRSGAAVCPLTACALKKYAGITVSGQVRIAAAVLFFVAGEIPLAVGI